MTSSGHQVVNTLFTFFYNLTLKDHIFLITLVFNNSAHLYSVETKHNILCYWRRNQVVRDPELKLTVVSNGHLTNKLYYGAF